MQEKQPDFVNALTKNGEDTLLRLVVIWRRDTSHIKFEWVSDASLHMKRTENDSAELNYNSTKQKLDNTIQRLLRTTEALSFEAEVGVSDVLFFFFLLYILYFLCSYFFLSFIIGFNG